MKLYNALSQSLDTFTPQGETITVYVCGITPYDTTHLGHAFTYATFDILIRYLEYKGHQVNYVQNVTDIDDDILRKANNVNDDWQELGNRWTAYFIRDMKTLNIRPPEHFPRATDVIPEMIEIVSGLLEAGLAYEAGGSVYFHIDSWSDYGKLSRLSRQEMLPVANERGNNPDDPHKQDPLDFVLWQAQSTGEPAWDSPWGPGRPGWHIECSTMCSSLLGNTVDIHGGGSDLIFPHHESEIAQAEGATGQKPFVRFWLHAAMVHHEGEKMSKSLGNLVMARDLLEDWSPDALRLYMAAHHYREPWEHNVQALGKADWLARKLQTAITVSGGEGPEFNVSPTVAAFTGAMDNDLDTPTALIVLEKLAEAVEKAAGAGQNVHAAQEAIRSMARIFGLRLNDTTPEDRTLAGWDEHLKRFD